MTWATSVPILVFLGLSVLELGPMYATDRQTEIHYGIFYGARSAMRPCYILPPFFSAALVGQTAERIFTKLSHVVDIRRHLRTTRSIYSWPSLNYTLGQKMTKFLDPTRTFSALTPERAKYRNSKKIGSPWKVALHLCQFRRTLAYKPLRSRRRFTIFFLNCGF